MPKLEVYSKSQGQTLTEELFRTFTARAEVSATTTCPVELTTAFVKFAAAQSCGKCTPCRIGLAQLAVLLDQLLDGEADENMLTLLEDLAENIYLTSDCALGFEAGAFALRVIKGFRDDFIYHIDHNDCGADAFASVPCVEGCPAHVDVPAYMALVAEGRYEDAVRVVRKDNPFVAVCGLICEHPCELYCRRGMVDDPLNIRGIKRFAVDHSKNHSLPAKAEATGKRIAVVGGGPAGLTAAYFLALMGHTPVVYEQRSHLGGMLRYGIPPYRLPIPDLEKELEFLLSAGIGVQVNTKIAGSKNSSDENIISFEDLRRDHDAVYLAIGAHAENRRGLEGEDAQGVLSAVKLLRAVGDGDHLDFTGMRIIVVGGGNVAMDCARTALRLGADHVQIIYRRRRLDMTAKPEEIEAAIVENCELLELHSPVSIEAENGVVTGLTVKQQIISDISDGRANPTDSSHDPITLPCDIVLMAYGQRIDSESFEDAGFKVRQGAFITDSQGAIIGKEGVFSGGDCVTGPRTVIQAIAAGKAAAANIDAYLGHNHVIELDVEIPSAKFRSRIYCARSNMVEIDTENLLGNFDVVEKGLLPEEATQEANRCLRCDHFGLGAWRGGRNPQW